MKGKIVYLSIFITSIVLFALLLTGIPQFNISPIVTLQRPYNIIIGAVIIFMMITSAIFLEKQSISDIFLEGQ